MDALSRVQYTAQHVRDVHLDRASICLQPPVARNADDEHEIGVHHPPEGHVAIHVDERTNGHRGVRKDDEIGIETLQLQDHGGHECPRDVGDAALGDLALTLEGPQGHGRNHVHLFL